MPGAQPVDRFLMIPQKVMMLTMKMMMMLTMKMVMMLTGLVPGDCLFLPRVD